MAAFIPGVLTVKTMINEWARRHGVSQAAVADLHVLLMSAVPESTDTATGSEAAAQQRIRLEAPEQGVRLWRNNVGACMDDNGNFIRYGLANESSAMNKKIKSSDLIGITPITVLPEHVGGTLGLFTAVECKRPGWRYRSQPREQAQLAFMQVVIALGGIAQFATDPCDIWTKRS